MIAIEGSNSARDMDVCVVCCKGRQKVKMQDIQDKKSSKDKYKEKKIPAEGVGCSWGLLCRQRPLRQADASCRGVLPGVRG